MLLLSTLISTVNFMYNVRIYVLQVLLLLLWTN